jgi:hypothetical protein
VSGAEIPRRPFAVADARIEPLADDVDDAVLDHEFDLDVGKFVDERLEHGDDQEFCGVLRRIDAKQPDRKIPLRFELAERFVDRREADRKPLGQTRSAGRRNDRAPSD